MKDFEKNKRNAVKGHGTRTWRCSERITITRLRFHPTARQFSTRYGDGVTLFGMRAVCSGVFIACLAVVFTQCIISLLYGHTIATMILTMPVSNACRPRAESCSRHCVAPTDDRPRCVYRMCHIHTFSRLSKHPQTQARTHTSAQSPNEWCAQYAKVCESVDSLVGRCVVG